MIDKLARFIVQKRNKIGIIFILLIIISLFLIPRVNINYDLSEYVPDTERSKQGMNIVEEEFAMQGFARVMINNVTLVQAKEYKDKIEKVDGVDLVLWLDDSVDIYRPIEFIPEDVLKDYYNDGSAIFEIMFEEDDYSLKTDSAIDEIKKIIPEDSNMIGSAVDTKSSREKVQTEIKNIMLILIPVVIIILILTTNSYLSPLLFIVIIGTSILLNMGTNVIFEHVSFLTYSIVAALQLAVSMDYSVFVLHEFEDEDKENIEEAMVRTIKKSCLSICSSALTTVAGFVALVFMGFTIGKDMGLVFAKGIIFSLISVLFFMPCLILKFYPVVAKFNHKPFLPSFDKFAKYTSKISYVLIAIVILITVPSYVAQKQNEFLYGASSFGGGEGTKVYEDEKKIIEKFGRSNPIIVLVPTGDYISEKSLGEEIEDLEVVKKVQSLVTMVQEGIPDSFVPIDNYQKFRTDNYSRFVIYLKTSSESETAFEAVNTIKSIAEKYYGDNYEITGTIPVTMDIKNVVNKDYNIVNLISIGMVMIILLCTFKSIILPILLIIVIESGIFINMAIPYYMGFSIMFLGYLIVSSIQLGATIDYAILMTNNYLDFRKTNDKKQASHLAVSKSVPSIITSGGILVSAAYLIKFCSTMNAVSELGELIGRGALLSMFLVIFFLPHVLVIFDGLIQKTSFENLIKHKKDSKAKEIDKEKELDKIEETNKSKEIEKAELDEEDLKIEESNKNLNSKKEKNKGRHKKYSKSKTKGSKK